jgi:hypothetical protein
MTKTTTYYIDENEDVIEFLLKNDVEISKSVIEQISFISNKTANNYIGFYQFKNKEEYVKFYIIPKIYKNVADNQKEKKFVKFLSKYYELSNKYSEINNVAIKGNITDLIIENSNQIDGAGINDFLQEKYKFALNRLDKFFRKHNKKRKIKTSFSSQTVKARIDLRKNVASIDKSNIYQIKTEEQAYSIIAFIAEQALVHFQKEKLGTLIDAGNKKYKTEIEDLSHSVLNTIRKKYKTRQRGIFKDYDIISYKITKLFRKSILEVYEALLIIIGLEHYKSDKYSSEIQKLPEMTALFFRPEDLYEWIVYDELKQRNQNAEILRKNEGLKYKILTNSKEITRSSEPDFVIIDNNLVTVVDAKWKILDKVSDIKFEDIAKLERDYILRKDITKNKEVKAQLVYPKIKFSPEEYNPMHHCYNENFEFEVMEVEVEK